MDKFEGMEAALDAAKVAPVTPDATEAMPGAIGSQVHTRLDDLGIKLDQM